MNNLPPPTFLVKATSHPADRPDLKQRTGRDCTRCSLAWLFKLNYEDVPDFEAGTEAYYGNVQAWLHTRGYAMVSFRWDQVVFDWFGKVKVHCLLSAKSKNFADALHHVVGRFEFKDDAVYIYVDWDPAVSTDGIYDIVSVDLLVRL